MTPKWLSEKERCKLRTAARLARMSPEQRLAYRAVLTKKERERWARRNPNKIARNIGHKNKQKCLICLFRCGLGNCRISKILVISKEQAKLWIRALPKDPNRRRIFRC